MKKALCIIGMLALVASANATVEFFFTSSTDAYGLVNPANALVATGTNHTDYIDGWALNGAGAPPLGAMGDVELDLGGSDWAYIWGRFNNEITGAQINGISIGINNAGVGQGNIAWYKGDSSQDFVTPPYTGFMRWDGDTEVFYFNHAGLIALTASGVRNLPTDQPLNMYVGGDQRTFLLGAVNLPSWAAIGDELTFTYGVTPVNYGAAPPAPNPDVVSMNKVVVVPEPAAMLLLGLAGLVLRRR